MAITDQQRAFRAVRIGSSDSPRLMAGAWSQVWREKTGRADPPDLDMVPAVQIGIATEPLHGRFYTHRTGVGCMPAGHRTYEHPSHPWMVAHLDYLTWAVRPADPDEPPDTVLEAKFCGTYLSDEELVERYWWQLQHQMAVGGFRQAVLSILRPGSYSAVPVPRDDKDIGVLIETLRAFWWHVENDVEPAVDPLAVAPPPMERMRVLDMAMHNEFASLGGVLMANRTAVTVYREAEQKLKALMPADCRVAYLNGDRAGGEAGLVLTRSRDGRLSLRFGAPARRDHDRADVWMPDGPGGEAEPDLPFTVRLVASGAVEPALWEGDD
ncbi:MAG TPA: YqaJ viral recombinase family protein [Azospirillaceae bacterium]|nr:YqaJ viral recombinase family protein [Azospirillaceae bacterium]